jgi:predicted dehydrogenase
MAGGGPVFDVGVHIVDLVRYLLGGESLLELEAMTRPYDPSYSGTRSVEASGNAILTFKNDVVALLSCSFEMPYLTKLDIQGTECWLTADYWNVLDHDTRIDVYSDQKLGEPEQTFLVNNGNFYTKMIDSFTDRVETGSEPPEYAGIADGLANQEIIDVWENCTRLVPPDNV